jgi:hypothetical protein
MRSILVRVPRGAKRPREGDVNLYRVPYNRSPASPKPGRM